MQQSSSAYAFSIPTRLWPNNAIKPSNNSTTAFAPVLKTKINKRKISRTSKRKLINASLTTDATFLHFLKEDQAVQADPKEVQAAKVLEVVKAARVVKKVLEVAKATRKAAKDVREQAAVIATDSASKPSATRPKITCCNVSANPTPVSTSLTNKVLEVPEVTEVPAVLEAPVATEDSEVVITMALAQAVLEALVAPEAMDSKEANNSFSKHARTTKPTPIKPRPVCPTPS